MLKLPKDIKRFTYDVAPLSVDVILRHRGIDVLARHYAHRIEVIRSNPELVAHYSWNDGLYENIMNEEGITNPTPYQLALFRIKQRFESAPEGVRSKFNLATQVSGNLGKVSRSVSVVNLRGRTCRFDDRETSDLDLGIYFDKISTQREVKLLLMVAQDAMEKTGIGIDLVSPFIPLNRGSFEHSFENYGEKYVGYPVYSREERFLEEMFQAKNAHYDEGIEQAREAMEKLKEMGLPPPMVIEA